MRLLPILLLSAFTLFATHVANAGDKVVFAGSTTVLPFMEKMTPLFKKQGMDIEVQAGGSSVGYKTAYMGMADIGMMSREMKESEAKNLKKLAIARDWLIMITHKDAPIDNITSEQVVDIYTGKIKKLGDFKINAIAKENGRGTKEVFDHYFHLGKKYDNPIDPSLVIIGPNGQSITTLANDPHGLAYLSYSAVEAAIKQGEPIKMLTLDGIDGSKTENVLNGKYKLQRTLNLVYKEKKADLIERVKSVLATDEARKIFKDNGVQPDL